MGNIVRSLIREFLPKWPAGRAIGDIAGRTVARQPDEIKMPVETKMPAPKAGPSRGPYRPTPTPSHWRAPNM